MKKHIFFLKIIIKITVWSLNTKRASIITILCVHVRMEETRHNVRIKYTSFLPIAAILIIENL